MVSVTSGAMDRSALTRYGLPAVVQVVVAEMLPDTVVPCACASVCTAMLKKPGNRISAQVNALDVMRARNTEIEFKKLAITWLISKSPLGTGANQRLARLRQHEVLLI